MSLPPTHAGGSQRRPLTTPTLQIQMNQQQHRIPTTGSTRLPSVHINQHSNAASGPSSPTAASGVSNSMSTPQQPPQSHSLHSNFLHSHRQRTPHTAATLTPAKMTVVNLSAQNTPQIALDQALIQPIPALQQSLERRRKQFNQHSTTSSGLRPTTSHNLSRLYPMSPAELAASQGVDASLFRRVIPFVPRSLPTANVRPSPVMNYWMNQLEWERRKDYTSDLVIWETQLQEMLTNTGFDELSPQRVALICDLIDQISSHVGRWAPILRRIVRELFSAIYQSYDIEDLEVTVPIWSQEGASWIGWQTPTFGDSFEQDLEGTMASSFHPLSPLSDAHMYGPGVGDPNSNEHAPLAAPPMPTDPEPPRAHFFRHHQWELTMATWHDLMVKYEEGQREISLHRARVAQDLGMTLTKDGQRIVVEVPPSTELNPVPSPLTIPPSKFDQQSPLELADEQGDVLTPLHRVSSPNHSNLPHLRLDGNNSSALVSPRSQTSLDHAKQLPPRTPRAASLNQGTFHPLVAASSPKHHPTTGRPLSSMELQRQSIIDEAKSAVLSERDAANVPLSPRSKYEPLTSQSMSALQSSNVGSMVEQAMMISKRESKSMMAGSTMSTSSASLFEEKEQSLTHASSPSPVPGKRDGLSDVEAVTAAAFQTINNLISTPPIPADHVIAYFDVSKRLNMQYDNLYKRIKNWAVKQQELQNSSGKRDQVLNRIARRLKFTIFYNVFHRWAAVVQERKRQLASYQKLFAKYHTDMAHIKHRFLVWKVNALQKKTALLERQMKETANKNMVLQSEINEQKYIKEKELERKNILKTKDLSLMKDRDEIKSFLDACQNQIKEVQDSNLTKLISTSIGMIQESITNLWKELKEARASHLQDPCRMLVSSTVLTEHVQKPYTHMPEGSIEWANSRKDEVKRVRLRLSQMLDSDLLLLWFNYHLAQAHLKVNNEKLQAKFYGQVYKYDVPGRYPPHVRNFYSSDASLVRRAENFTSSLQDCEVFTRLLTQIAPHLVDVDVLAHVDLEVRGKKFLKILDLLNHDAASLITPMDLTHSFSPDLMAALIGRLMMTTPSIPVDSGIFVDKKKRKRSEYAPVETHLTSIEKVRQSDIKAMTEQFGLSTKSAERAHEMMVEEARIDAMQHEENAALLSPRRSMTGDPFATPIAPPTPSLMTHRDEAPVVAARRSRRNSFAFKKEEPSIQELEEEEAERAVKDCGPFTDILRALHLVNRELTTRARVEVNLVNHISGSVSKVLNTVRVLLDDAYERHQLWLTIRRRVGAFISIVMTHQMRGEPLIMQDRKAIRQIRRYTKLLDRSGKPQQRFMDLLHPWNRTSNDHFFKKGGIKEESSEHDSDDQSEDGESKKKKKKSKKAKDTDDDDSDEDSSDSSSESESSEDDDDDDDVESGGTRNADGDDIWAEYKPLTAKQLAAMTEEEQNREMRRLKNRNETQEDLVNQTIFELGKMQEHIAKHYTSIRDIFRAYSQMDNSAEQTYLDENKLNTPASSAVGGKDLPLTTKQLKQLAKEDRDDPTASMRRKLRENASSNSKDVEPNPQFSIHDFWLMVRDAKLVTKHFGVKKIEKIFEFVWARDLKAALTASGHIDASHPFETLIKDRTKMEVDCRQFVEILIRIAHQRMPSAKEREELLAELELDRELESERRRSEGTDHSGHAAGPGGQKGASGVEVNDHSRQLDALTRASISIGHTAGGPSSPTAGPHSTMNPAFEWGTPLFPSTRPGWALRLFSLIRCKLIPNAARLNIDHFRSQYKRMEVSVLYKKHGLMLRRLFYRYAKMHSVRNRHSQVDDDNAVSDSVWTNTIDYREFVQLLKDSKILDGRYLTLQQVYSIFANVQGDLGKVAQLSQEKDSSYTKPTVNKRASLKRNEIIVVQNSSSATSTAAATSSKPASGTNTPPTHERPHLNPQKSSDYEWGSGDFSKIGPVVNTLADLNLEHQAAATAIVPTDEQILADSATSNMELIFPEFLESLAAIACCRHPNPYKPIHIRLQHFLERDLLPWVQLIFATQQ